MAAILAWEVTVNLLPTMAALGVLATSTCRLVPVVAVSRVVHSRSKSSGLQGA